METTKQITPENCFESETKAKQKQNKGEIKTKKRRNKGEIRKEILELFAKTGGGVKTTQEIAKTLSANKGNVSTNLTALAKTGELVQVKYGLYTVNDEVLSMLRSEEQNEKTINKLLNLYDKILDRYSDLIEDTLSKDESKIEAKATLLNNFKALASVIDSLMKRWYLVHRGYDSNARQAQEDAKAKTEAREKEALKDAPIEDRVKIVGHFHTDLKELWDTMPKLEQEERKA